MKSIRFKFYCLAIGLLLIAAGNSQPSFGQKIDRIERERLKSMLSNIKSAVQKDYYDEKFHGIDIEARFKQAEDRLDQAKSTGQSLGIIAQTLMDFNDSHLYFLPPMTDLRVEYGWRMKMIGDKCFVTTVQPKSDADAKGLRPGDQILKIEGFKPSRKELWKMRYYYNVLSKRQGLNVVAQSPGTAEARELNLVAKLEKRPRMITQNNFFVLVHDFQETQNDKHLFRKVGNVVIWRMPSFVFEPSQADTFMDGPVAEASSLILDLRGNGGGYGKTLERLVSNLFEKNLKIADLKGRKAMDPLQAKTRGKGAFTGRIVVLVDSESGSASEILARLVQIENRGRVLGDVSSGAVMQARELSAQTGSGFTSVYYGASITNADVIMSDGKSVEHTGVTPDELIMPTPEDLATGRDPVLSRAVEFLGGQLSPEVAGKFFLYDWDGK